MKAEEFLDAVGGIDEKLINESELLAEAGQNRRRRIKTWGKVAAAAACLGLALFGLSHISAGREQPVSSGSTSEEMPGLAWQETKPAYTLSPEEEAALAAAQERREAVQEIVNAYLAAIHSESQNAGLLMTFVPVNNRVCTFYCRSGAYYDGAFAMSEEAKALNDRLEELKDEVLWRQKTETAVSEGEYALVSVDSIVAAQTWYRLKDMPGLKYLILEDMNGLSLWEFGSLYNPEAARQDPDIPYHAEEDPFRAAYLDANYGAITYGELYKLIYDLNGPEDILRITATAPTANGTARGQEIQRQIGTQTIEDPAVIERFYGIVRDVHYNTGDAGNLTGSRYTYSFSSEAKDATARLENGDTTWGGRYLTLTLRNGLSIDSLKYNALDGVFYEWNGVFSPFLSDSQVAAVNEIFGIR